MDRSVQFPPPLHTLLFELLVRKLLMVIFDRLLCQNWSIRNFCVEIVCISAAVFSELFYNYFYLKYSLVFFYSGLAFIVFF